MLYFRSLLISCVLAASAVLPAGSAAGGASPPAAVGPAASATPEWARACVRKPTSTRVVDVRDKGATGDGVTDDSAAFARAVAAVRGTGGTLLVPAGDYRIDPTPRSGSAAR